MWMFVCLAVLMRGVNGDFTPPGYEEVSSTENSGGFGAYDRCGQGEKSGHKCVVYHMCNPDTKTIIENPEEVNRNGYGLIDIRFGENLCEHPLDVCCKTTNTPQPFPTPRPSPPPPPPPPTPTTTTCGLRNTNGVDFKITGDRNNEAEYGEFPWMVAVLKKNSQGVTMAECGGSLIAPNVVLTGAHCVHKKLAEELKVRAGEWDTQTDRERLPYQERDVAKIVLNGGFIDGILHNDVALLFLQRPFKMAEHIATICLPSQGAVTQSNKCIATGWGKDRFGKEGEYQVILKKIELPTVERGECQEKLRGTRLGKHFELHESFMCAGGEKGKDTCTGDGGGPLVCPDQSHPGRYFQAGIVAWGIGCGTDIPGVYADVGKFRNWIDGQMQRLNVNSDSYSV